MLRPFSINVRFARAGGAFIVMDSRHANFTGDSKYHVVSFIFTDFKVDLIQGVK